MEILTVIDTQDDFISGSLRNEEAIKAVPNIVKKIDNFDGDVIYVTQDTHDPDYLYTPEGNKLFGKEVEAYINRHSEALHEPCPITLIPFADNDKAIFFGLFGIKDSDIKKIIHEMTTVVSDQANFKLVRQNPIFTVFYCCIRFYTLKNDQVGINRSLIIYALSAYPSIFSKYFKHGANPGVMKYTADTLTNKFIIKQQGHVFGALNVSIQNSYKFLKPFFKDGNDTEVIRFICSNESKKLNSISPKF